MKASPLSIEILPDFVPNKMRENRNFVSKNPDFYYGPIDIGRSRITSRQVSDLACSKAHHAKAADHSSREYQGNESREYGLL